MVDYLSERSWYQLFSEHLRHRTPFSKLNIEWLAVTYRKSLAHNLLCFINYRLIYLVHVTLSFNHICCIVVPISFWRVILDNIHASPALDHMDEYKKSYRIKLCFFWSQMRSDIKNWVKQFPHCMLTYKWRRRCHDIMFSWPISSPFAISVLICGCRNILLIVVATLL